ncbi:MAG: calcium/sodium antiporter [bacterium]
MSVLFLILGFILLVIGGEYLVRSSVALSFKLNISKMVIGLTVVSFATSAPELLVSINAAMNGAPAIAINNVVGSNIANIGLVLGITALVGAIAVDKMFLKVHWPTMALLSGVLYVFLKNDNQLVFWEGAILLCTLVLFILYVLKKTPKDELDDDVDTSLSNVSNVKIFIWLLIGGSALYFGSDWLVDGAIDVAEKLGVSEAVISVTMIAIGTSVPELAASVIAAAKKEKAISLGNLIGSNIFNIGSVLGLTSMITSIPVTDDKILSRDIFFMLLFAAILIPLVLIRKKMQISRIKGFVLVLLYSIFILMAFFS